MRPKPVKYRGNLAWLGHGASRRRILHVEFQQVEGEKWFHFWCPDGRGFEWKNGCELLAFAILSAAGIDDERARSLAPQLNRQIVSRLQMSAAATAYLEAAEVDRFLAIESALENGIPF